MLNSSQLQTKFTGCYLCQASTESTAHLFLSCPIVRILWGHSFWPINLHCIQPLNIPEFIIRILLQPNSKLHIPIEDTHHFQLFAAISCDQIWAVRNRVRLAPTSSIQPFKLTADIKRLSLEHRAAWLSKTSNFKISSVLNTSTPSLFKVQFDAAVKSNFSVAAVVCLDIDHRVLTAQTKYLPEISDPLCAQAMAAQLAADLCNFLGPKECGS